MSELEIQIKENEYWWGGAVADGLKMPLSKDSAYCRDCTVNHTANQFNGVFVSSAGRYISFNGGAKIEAKDGILKISGVDGEICFSDSHKTLRGAVRAAAEMFFKPPKNRLKRGYLTEPQFCTWSEMLTHVTGEKLVAYAKNIRETGLSGELIIIDDGWSKDYGDWRFDEKKFPDPQGSLNAVRALGFDIALWVVPFVNKGAPDYRDLEENGAFAHKKGGETAEIEWWNGKSAMLDFSSAYAVAWFKRVLCDLQKKYGVVGFKFDAGGSNYFADLKTGEWLSEISPAKQCLLWSEFVADFSYSELRECQNCGAEGIVQRLSDKRANWGSDGLNALIPNILQAGLCGYYYCCADMIGGGQIADYENMKEFDLEFYKRSAQCASLFPVTQFSYAFWNLSPELKKVAKALCDTRERYKDYFELLIDEAQKKREPIVRALEYEFPKQGLHGVRDSFMLGDKLLVSPVTEKGAREKNVNFPAGYNWKDVNTSVIYQGGIAATVPADEETLPIFERIGIVI